MNKKYYCLILCALPLVWQLAYAQKNPILDKFSVKVAYSLSLTQYGISPFSDTRPLRRGINSILFNAQFAQPIKKTELCVGLQVAERGVKYDYSIVIPQVFSTQVSYEERLYYIELPITAIYHYKKIGFIIGAMPQYIYTNYFRYTHRDFEYDANGNIIDDFSTFSAITEKQVLTKNRYYKWNVGTLIGTSLNLYKGIDLEFTAQNQLFHINRIFKRDHDISYSITLALGFRYRFLSKI